ncbi:hypothetical protein [Hellea balneolensis]|uniref:hypothetical protein n=1 Tax=Hellea balneolensis TaxID=287478 RepID=UPI000418D6B3|nr:hypothetical protein [Hellea balneolensis]
MPRAQKHPAHLRHSLEKLRLDVALKRARLVQAQRIANKPIPYEDRLPLTDERIEAVEAKTTAVEKDLSLVKSQRYLNHIEKCLKEEMKRQGIKSIEAAKP